MRRTVLFPSILALSSLLFGCSTYPTGPATSKSAPSTWQADPLVRTAYGFVEGVRAEEETLLWRAIPFASPPVGELRWRAPVEPEPWSGVRRMASFPPQCTQYFPIFGGVSGSEDCLYLNIWRPATEETGLPVYVWIHGGGNTMGGATMVPSYLGHGVAARSNMVFVSVQYRLGPFGWLSHPALREGVSESDDSGNYGTLDLIQSLKWIQENIGAFGGDPANVTITGESAGGMNVLSLLISPLAEGLFSKAVCQSGMPTTATNEQSEETVQEMLVHLLVKDGHAEADAEVMLAGMSPTETRSYLRGKSDRDILRSLPRGLTGMTAMPTILTDGYVLPRDGYETLVNGTYVNKVPLVIGTNRDENKLFLALANELSWQSDEYHALAEYGSLLWKANGADGIAAAVTNGEDSPPVYTYLFSWGTPNEDGQSPLPGINGQKLGAFHSLEIPFLTGSSTIFGPFFYGNLFTAQNRAGREALSDAMMRYVAQFARTGNPNAADGLPVWSPWSNDDGAPKYIIFDVKGDTPSIRMTNEAVTADGVWARMQEELEEPLRSFVAERLGPRHF